ncbi:MAG: multidrug ABC transporter ATP-binding protein, partial [Clostridia bacterium]|nr:multidrug ABC transporter ATP-binding protein [Clostridia bacterium]
KKEEAARQRRLKTQIEKAEQEIAHFEGRQAEIEEMLCNPENSADYEKIGELSLELEEVKQKISDLFEVWEELSGNIE